MGRTRKCAAVLGTWVVVSAAGAVRTSGFDGLQEPLPHDNRIRMSDQRSTSLLSDGLRRSDTLARLVSHILVADVVVYLAFSPEPGTWRGGTTLLGVAGGRRLLNVKVNLGLEPRERLAVLGHELQHVCEVSSAPDVVDGESMRRLFQKIGHRTSATDNHYETPAAQAVERQVRAELAHD